jgi:hypothetical protein
LYKFTSIECIEHDLEWSIAGAVVADLQEVGLGLGNITWVILFGFCVELQSSVTILDSYESI